MMTSEHVLVVDDDEFIIRMFDDQLTAAGFTTECYRRPEAALEAIRCAPPAVIIADFMMPGMDGIALLKQARSLAPGCVRVLCTAVGDFNVAMQALNAGQVYRLLSKPVHRDELIATVRQALDAVRLQRENQRLDSELRRHNLELEELVRQRTTALLDGLVAALDYRDAETQWHSHRVAQYARRLGRELGIAEPDLTVIERGALLHDVGKIGVRDAILLKPGPLTDEEQSDMRRHVELGWALLQGVEFLRVASPIVLQHHERWDGTGYPRGLAADEIALGARIFQVVDTFDAITSDRPYRTRRGYRAASEELLRCSGTQFDPAVVDAFLAVPPSEWTQIRAAVDRVARGDPHTGAAPDASLDALKRVALAMPGPPVSPSRRLDTRPSAPSPPRSTGARRP